LNRQDAKGETTKDTKIEDFQTRLFGSSFVIFVPSWFKLSALAFSASWWFNPYRLSLPLTR
jgi:hypothetical protein